MVFETLAPRDPSATGTLSKAGDSLALNTTAAGVLKIECKTIDGVKEEGKRLLTTLEIPGEAGVQRFDDHFQIGQSTDEYKNPTEAIRTTNHRLQAPGKDAKVTLKKLSKSGLVTISAEYYPEYIPFQWVCTDVSSLFLPQPMKELRHKVGGVPFHRD